MYRRPGHSIGTGTTPSNAPRPLPSLEFVPGQLELSSLTSTPHSLQVWRSHEVSCLYTNAIQTDRARKGKRSWVRRVARRLTSYGRLASASQYCDPELAGPYQDKVPHKGQCLIHHHQHSRTPALAAKSRFRWLDRGMTFGGLTTRSRRDWHSRRRQTRSFPQSPSKTPRQV